MNERSLFDELCALASGTLSSEEEAGLRERCASDPELQRQLEDYLDAHAATEMLPDAAPPCRVTFDEVEGALASRRVWREVLHRYWRVAAAVLVLVGGGLLMSQWFAAGDGGDGPGREAGPTVLASIPLTVDELPEHETKLPKALADYRPLREGEIQWIDSFAEAQVVARLSSRPVLLFRHHPTCPACLSMKKDVFGDPAVQAQLTRFVPAMSDVMKELPELTGGSQRGWPWFGVVDAEGGIVLSFPGVHTAADFAERLSGAAKLVGPAVMSWERINDLAGRLEQARTAEEEGRLGAAHASYSALAGDADAGAFAAEADAGSRRLAQSARRALVQARSLAGSPPGVPAALAGLRAAEARFAGSPLGTDLAAVRARLSKSGEFPVIEGLAD